MSIVSIAASTSAHSALAAAHTDAAVPAPFDPSQLDAVNEQLADASPKQILEWAIDHLPGLFQTTAMGITGLAATDMVASISKKRKQAHLVPVIFVDTLYHFQETLDLVKEVEKKYKLEVQVFRPPSVETVAEFETQYGAKLWETDEDTYDYLVKVRFSVLPPHPLIPIDPVSVPLLFRACPVLPPFRLSPPEEPMTLWASRPPLPDVDDRKEPTALLSSLSKLTRLA